MKYETYVISSNLASQKSDPYKSPITSRRSLSLRPKMLATHGLGIWRGNPHSFPTSEDQHREGTASRNHQSVILLLIKGINLKLLYFVALEFQRSEPEAGG
jgi:hypothetical protein